MGTKVSKENSKEEKARQGPMPGAAVARSSPSTNTHQTQTPAGESNVGSSFNTIPPPVSISVSATNTNIGNSGSCSDSQTSRDKRKKIRRKCQGMEKQRTFREDETGKAAANAKATKSTCLAKRERIRERTRTQIRSQFRDGTHQDLPAIHRNHRERRIREDVCIICLEGCADGKPVEMFSACCGQAYHVGCYIRQLSFDNLNHGSSRECGVCRTALPKLEDDGMSMYIKSFTSRGVSSVRAHRGKREIRRRTFLHSNEICYNNSNDNSNNLDDNDDMWSRSSHSEIRLYLFTR